MKFSNKVKRIECKWWC